MLKFSKKVDYALVLMTDLVDRKEKLVTSSFLATHYGLSKDLISNLLKALAKHKLIESVRGKYGGYRLNIEASKISLKDIIYAIEGPVNLLDCCSSDKSKVCLAQSVCRPKPAMIKLSKKINNLLESVNLEEMVCE